MDSSLPVFSGNLAQSLALAVGSTACTAVRNWRGADRIQGGRGLRGEGASVLLPLQVTSWV